MKNSQTTDLKREFLVAVLAGDKERAIELRRRIMFTKEMPFFIEYTVKNEMHFLSWGDLVLTKEQFDKLKSDCPQQVFWEEIKTYENADG